MPGSGIELNGCVLERLLAPGMETYTVACESCCEWLTTPFVGSATAWALGHQCWEPADVDERVGELRRALERFGDREEGT